MKYIEIIPLSQDPSPFLFLPFRHYGHVTGSVSAPTRITAAIVATHIIQNPFRWSHHLICVYRVSGLFMVARATFADASSHRRHYLSVCATFLWWMNVFSYVYSVYVMNFTRGIRLVIDAISLHSAQFTQHIAKANVFFVFMWCVAQRTTVDVYFTTRPEFPQF